MQESTLLQAPKALAGKSINVKDGARQVALHCDDNAITAVASQEVIERLRKQGWRDAPKGYSWTAPAPKPKRLKRGERKRQIPNATPGEIWLGRKTPDLRGTAIRVGPSLYPVNEDNAVHVKKEDGARLREQGWSDLAGYSKTPPVMRKRAPERPLVDRVEGVILRVKAAAARVMRAGNKIAIGDEKFEVLDLGKLGVTGGGLGIRGLKPEQASRLLDSGSWEKAVQRGAPPPAGGETPPPPASNEAPSEKPATAKERTPVRSGKGKPPDPKAGQAPPIE